MEEKKNEWERNVKVEDFLSSIVDVLFSYSFESNELSSEERKNDVIDIANNEQEKRGDWMMMMKI